MQYAFTEADTHTNLPLTNTHTRTHTGHLDISSTAFTSSVELVSSTWPPKIISSKIVSDKNTRKTIEAYSNGDFAHIYSWETYN